MSSKDKVTELKALCLPTYLLCLISRDIMIDPVTLESGCTYERENIEQYFDIQLQKFNKAIETASSGSEAVGGGKDIS